MAEARAASQTQNSSVPTLAQQNQIARQAILATSIDMLQSINSYTLTNPVAGTNVTNIQPQNVGLVKRFLVEITATIAAPGGNTNALSLTEFGPANILSQIYFTDLQNNVRINTAGWHMNFLDTVKRQRPFGASYTNDSPVDYGNGSAVISAPATIAAGATGTIRMFYSIPLAYSDTDFRGAIYLGVTNATANLQLTVNPVPVSANGADSTLAVYKATHAGDTGSITSITVNVYQNYLNQLPFSKNGGVILPINDISTIYLLQNTTLSGGLVINQDFPIPYANFRDFLSTFAVYDNGGTLNYGGDINYWAIQIANFVNTFKVDPNVMFLQHRNQINTDFPKGVYYFNHRHKPISTQQQGNQNLVLNASSVGSGSSVLIGFEMFALVNLIAQAGSLTGGAQ